MRLGWGGLLCRGIFCRQFTTVIDKVRRYLLDFVLAEGVVQGRQVAVYGACRGESIFGELTGKRTGLQWSRARTQSS
jgi:hypothetical protein